MDDRYRTTMNKDSWCSDCPASRWFVSPCGGEITSLTLFTANPHTLCSIVYGGKAGMLEEEEEGGGITLPGCPDNTAVQRELCKKERQRKQHNRHVQAWARVDILKHLICSVMKCD